MRGKGRGGAGAAALDVAFLWTAGDEEDDLPVRVREELGCVAESSNGPKPGSFKF